MINSITVLISIAFIIFSNFCFAQPCKVEKLNSELDKETAYIRYQVSVIEHDMPEDKKAEKIKIYNELTKKCDELISKYPEKADPYTWKGICLSAQAKYLGLSALPNVFSAKKALEKSIEINPGACNAAALNAMGMLYHKVPHFPMGFGSDEKAEEFFKQALKYSSNLDTNYRYGEFLIEKGETEKGLKYLEKALNFPDRQGRKEDPLKKKGVKKLIKSVKDKQTKWHE